MFLFFVVIFLVPTSTPRCLFLFCFNTNFTTNFYHKLLLQTTIIIGGSISTITPILFQSNNFSIVSQILPQTTTTNHYYNGGVNIYYHTNVCSNLTMFQIYYKFHHTFYHNHTFLPQTTTTIPTIPLTFSVPKRNPGKCL